MLSKFVELHCDGKKEAGLNKSMQFASNIWFRFEHVIFITKQGIRLSSGKILRQCLICIG